MNNGKKLTCDELKRLAMEIVDKFEPLEIKVDEESLKTFCRLTGHDYSLYREKNLIPQGYFMTMIIPTINQFFTLVASRMIPGIVKGFIHTSSRIEFCRPMKLGDRHFGKMLFKDAVEKKGRLGDYFAADFEVLVADEKGGKTVSDIHQFFLRV